MELIGQIGGCKLARSAESMLLMMGTARLLAWRTARPCCRRAPAAAVRSSRILRHSASSAALAAAAAALISAMRAAFCSTQEFCSTPATAPCWCARTRASTAWPWRGPLLAATLWQQGLWAGLPAPRGPPGRSLRCVWPVCVASLCGQENRQPFGCFGTRGAPKRDPVSTLDSQVEERTSRFAPNFGCPAATFWNTA